MRCRSLLFASVAVLFLPFFTCAHEVYVLSPEQVAYGLSTSPVSPLAVVNEHLLQFAFWAFIALFAIIVAFFISTSRKLETALDPLLMRGKRYAPAVARITIGLGLLASAWYQALFGPEMSFDSLFGPFAPIVTAALTLSGIAILANKWVRGAALIALAVFAAAVVERGYYMLTYTNYVGEIAVLLLGLHASMRAKDRLHALARRLAPYSFAIIRVCFGISLLFASFYAKLLHGNLALQVASVALAGHAHSLAYYFGFEPQFLVLGASLVELLIGTFFILGIEIRFTALFLEFWLALSLIFFGEVVWPHIILIGIPIALFLHGYDRYSLEGRFFKQHRAEPVL